MRKIRQIEWTAADLVLEAVVGESELVGVEEQRRERVLDAPRPSRLQSPPCRCQDQVLLVCRLRLQVVDQPGHTHRLIIISLLTSLWPCHKNSVSCGVRDKIKE
jgi:hypothetical protein